MDSRKIIGIIGSAAAVLGLFMPIASAGQVYVCVHHLGGLSFALYLLLPALFVLAIMRQYKPFAGDRGWIMGVGGVAILLLATVRYFASSVLIQFANLGGMFNGEGGAANQVSEISTGAGTFLILLGTVISVTMAAIDRSEPARTKPSQAGETSE